MAFRPIIHLKLPAMVGLDVATRHLKSIVAVALLLIGLLLTGALPADVVRWDNGQLIPDGIGVTLGPGVDLSARELPYARLYFQDLTNANFQDSNLSRADLQQSALVGATFRNANLTGAFLYQTTLGQADFADAIVEGASFDDTTSRGFTEEQFISSRSYQQQNLRGMNLRFNDLSGWSFAGQDLSGTDLFDSTLTGADFSAAIIQGAGLGRSTEIGFTKNQLYATASYQQLRNLSGVNLAANNLNHWDFSGQNLTDARFAGSSLSFTNFEQAEIVGADFAETTSRAFHPLQLYSTASYQRKDLRGVRLSNNDLTGWDFHGQDLTNASLNYSTVSGADFSDATITNLHFYEATQWGFTKEQLYSTASYKQKNLKGILISGDLSGWDFSGQDLSNARLGAKLINADFSGAWVSGAQLGSIRAEQLASTASYQAKNLRGISLAPNANQQWDFRGQDLTGADLRYMNLLRVDLTGALIQGVNFQSVRTLNPEQIYSTASYQIQDLRDINVSLMDLENWSFANQDLSGAAFYSSTLKNANFGGATIEGGNFDETTALGFTKEQLYSTSSYQAKELGGIGLRFNNLNGWNFSGQDLTNGIFHSSTMENVNLSFADMRGASDMDFTSANVRNSIRPDGSLTGLEVHVGDRLVVRNYLGNPNDFHLAPMPVVVLEQMSMTDGALRMHFDAEEWHSTIYFQEGIDVQLGGGLELEFATGVATANQAGRSFKVFDWNGVSPAGQFEIHSSYLWDTTELYSLGEVTLISGQWGDTNGDNVVDVSDLNAVRNNFGASGAPGLPGDAIPFDGVVDVSDLNYVRNSFGLESPVPEPRSITLAIFALGGLGVWRTRDNRLRQCAAARSPAPIGWDAGRSCNNTRHL